MFGCCNPTKGGPGGGVGAAANSDPVFGLFAALAGSQTAAEQVVMVPDSSSVESEGRKKEGETHVDAFLSLVGAAPEVAERGDGTVLPEQQAATRPPTDGSVAAASVPQKGVLRYTPAFVRAERSGQGRVAISPAVARRTNLGSGLTAQNARAREQSNALDAKSSRVARTTARIMNTTSTYLRNMSTALESGLCRLSSICMCVVRAREGARLFLHRLIVSCKMQGRFHLRHRHA